MVADHARVGLSSFACQHRKDAVGHVPAAPADEAVVDSVVPTVALGRIATHQPMLDDTDDPRHDLPVIHSGNTMRQREKWLNPEHLRLAQKNGTSISSASETPTLNQSVIPHKSNIMCPELNLTCSVEM